MSLLKLNIKQCMVGSRLLYTVQVVHQVHRRSVFNIDRDTFIASNGFELLSTGYPMLYCTNTHKEPITLKGKRIVGASTGYINKMCVRGSDRYMDNHIIYIDSPAYIEKLKVAVKEYNAER